MPANRRSDLTITQNFLRSPKLVSQLLRDSSIGPEDLVVEIGSGTGIITERLATSCRQVLAIEKDPALARGLRQRLARYENVALFETDILAFPMPISPYKVFSSIPFNVTAAIIGQLTSRASAPEDAFLIVQSEAAARFLGQPKESLAALLIKPWFEPTIVHRFRRHDFIPAPRVDVVMLRLRKRGPPLVAAHQTRQYRDFVTAVCTSWQPTIHASLAMIGGRPLARDLARQTKLDLNQPPMMLSFVAWLALFDAYAATHRQRHGEDRMIGAEQRLRDQQRQLKKDHRTRVATTSTTE